MPPFPQLATVFPRNAIRSKSTKIVAVCTDGSCYPEHPDGPCSGIGCYFAHNSPHNISGRINTSRPTALFAEFQAATLGLQKLRRAYPCARGYRIYTDCPDAVKLNEVSQNMPWLKKMGLEGVGKEFEGVVKGVEKEGGTVEVVKVERAVVSEANILAREGAKEGK